jgi:hypothetical protein
MAIGVIEVFERRSSFPQYEPARWFARYRGVRDAEGDGNSADEAIGQLLRRFGDRIGLDLTVKVVDEPGR